MLAKIYKSFKGKKIFCYFFNATEKNKSQKYVNIITSILLNKNFSRNDCLISIGGGITGDVSGFAASLFKRGLKFRKYTYNFTITSGFIYWRKNWDKYKIWKKFNRKFLPTSTCY